MTRSLAIGDRALLAGRLRTAGLRAMRRGKEYVVTTGGLPEAAALPCTGSLSSSSLLIALPVTSPLESPADERFNIGPLAPADDILRTVVRRFHPEKGRVQGVVKALHGGVRAECGGRSVILTDLIEVEFTQSDRPSAAVPPLEAADSGALVTTWEGNVVGLLVAGEGANGFVAPLEPFLEAEKLTHRWVERDAGILLPNLGSHAVEKEAAIASQRVELAHDGSFGLEAYLEAA